MTPTELETLMEEYVLKLGEHFDAVQIVACTVEGEGTRCLKRGSGNWYARKAMCQEFVERDQAVTVAEAIASATKRPDE